jgi:hypothetical protein
LFFFAYIVYDLNAKKNFSSTESKLKRLSIFMFILKVNYLYIEENLFIFNLIINERNIFYSTFFYLSLIFTFACRILIYDFKRKTFIKI